MNKRSFRVDETVANKHVASFFNFLFSLTVKN